MGSLSRRKVLLCIASIIIAVSVLNVWLFYRMIAPSPGQCRAIFSINPGRSGSQFLAKIFQRLPNTHGVHEDEAFLKYSVATKIEGMEKTFQRRKKQFIREVGPTILKRRQTYAESSLMFIHVLYDVAVDWLIEKQDCRVDVIVLRRYIPWVAESYTRNSTGPEFTRPDYRDLQSPWMWMDESKATLTKMPDAKSSELPWQMRECLYNLIETEARTQWFIKEYGHLPKLHIHEFRTEEITTPEGVKRLIRDLDMNVNWSDQFIRDMACRPVNAKPGEIAYSVEDIENIYIPQYLKEAKEQGIILPPLPQLELAIFPNTCL